MYRLSALVFGLILLGASLTCAKSSAPHYTYTLTKNPTGCPKILPTTSSGTLIFSASSNGPQATAYANKKGTAVAQFVSTNGNSNDPVIFQSSNTSRIVLFFSTQQRAWIDNDGAHLFTADCKNEFHLPVPNLVSVVQNAPRPKTSSTTTTSASTGRPVRSIERRAADPEVKVSVAYVDQCQKPIYMGHTADISCYIDIPGIQYEGKQDQPSLTAGADGVYSTTCKAIDVQKTEQECKDTLKNILDYPTSGLPGQLTNVPSDIAALGKILTTGIVGKGLANLARLAGRAAIADALIALTIYEQLVAAGGDSLASKALCGSSFSTVGFEVESSLDDGAAAPVNYQTASPFTAVTATRTVSLASVSCAPTCPPGVASASCADGASAACNGTAIAPDAQGQPVTICYDNEGCDIADNGPPCTADSDCFSAQQRCITQASNCCGQSICVYPADSPSDCAG